MEGEGEVIPRHWQRRGVHECLIEVENQRVSRPRVGARRARTTATLAALATALAAALAAAAAAVWRLAERRQRVAADFQRVPVPGGGQDGQVRQAAHLLARVDEALPLDAHRLRGAQGGRVGGGEDEQLDLIGEQLEPEMGPTGWGTLGCGLGAWGCSLGEVGLQPGCWGCSLGAGAAAWPGCVGLQPGRAGLQSRLEGSRLEPAVTKHEADPRLGANAARHVDGVLALPHATARRACRVGPRLEQRRYDVGARLR
eukprot:scaffold92312_cov36-Phaeocystis_antarctica.AAC.1